MTLPWEIQAQKARDILSSSIPQQWLIPADKLPSPDEKNVENFPRRSGLFSEHELAITEMSATKLVRDMGSGNLTAEEVVTAFLKRAVVGHQLVRITGSAEVYPSK